MARTSKRARRTSPLNLPGAFQLFTPSKEIVLKNLWIFGPLYAIPFIFWIHNWIWTPIPGQEAPWWRGVNGFGSGLVGISVPTYTSYIFIGFSLMWLVIILVGGVIAQIMSQAAQLEAAEGKRLAFDKLWATVREIGWRMVGLYIVIGLAVVIGLILLIIPGLIMLRRYYLAPYVMLDKKTGIREALDKSAKLSSRNTGSIWGILGVMFLISLINIVPIIGGLAAFALGSLYSVAPALRYQQLKRLA